MFIVNVWIKCSIKCSFFTLLCYHTLHRINFSSDKNNRSHTFAVCLQPAGTLWNGLERRREGSLIRKRPMQSAGLLSVCKPYWVIQNDCGQVWQLCTKMYVATVWMR
jgi:hypothetical protein